MEEKGHSLKRILSWETDSRGTLRLAKHAD
jgi:hypothetical protein